MKELKAEHEIAKDLDAVEWNPVKELKVTFDARPYLRKGANLWNPVKELKDLVEREASRHPLIQWNPVKELKGMMPSRRLSVSRSWNPVKELKGYSVSRHPPTLLFLWNPVKELKDFVPACLVLALAKWNPVKELKDQCQIMTDVRGVAVVESGEGIESAARPRCTADTSPHVESGEGIERWPLRIEAADVDREVESGEGIESTYRVPRHTCVNRLRGIR